MQIVFLNGSFIPLSEAKISVMDRGFLFGDGVYEVIPVFNGTPFGLHEHLGRLCHSANSIKIGLDLDIQEIESVVLELLKQNGIMDGDHSVYLQVTRGVDVNRSFAFTEKLKPTIFAITKKVDVPSFDKLQQGISAITLDDIRWKYCEIKSISLLPSVLLYNQVFGADCHEGILIRDGYALEGISSNIFIVKNEQIITPPLSENNLSGVTRDLLLRILRQNSLKYAEQKILKDDLFTADELWISSSTRGLIPVVILDGMVVGSGKSGALWNKVAKLYLEFRDGKAEYV